MSDRLTELRRQRALVQEHLAWLEREIATAAPTSIPPETPPPTPAFPATSVSPPAPLPSTPSSTVAPSTAASSDDALLDQYRVAPAALRNEVQKGCLLYFVGGIALLFLGIFGLWFVLRR